MIYPDYNRLVKITNIASGSIEGDFVAFITLAHIKTNGFVFLNRGLFAEHETIQPHTDIDKTINESVVYWNNNYNGKTDINELAESINKGSYYTDINIRNMVYEFYSELLQKR